MLRRLVILLAAGAGGLASSQLPEFAQQYRQRLGGALEEMRQVVVDFDADAARNRLTREEALSTFGRSPENFLRDRGTTIGGVIRRYEHLAEQQARLEEAPPLLRPLVVLDRPDERVARGAWNIFEPAVPVSAAGFAWGAIGAFLIGGLLWIATLPFRRRRGAAASAAYPPARTGWRG